MSAHCPARDWTDRPRCRLSFPAQAVPPTADGGAVGLTASVVKGNYMESKVMMEQKEYQGPIVIDARVSIASGGLHSYVGIEPIDIDLDSDTDGLVLYQEGEMIVGYYPRFWRAVETFNPRPLWQWQDEQRRAMSYEPTTPTVDRDRIVNGE